ncbi:translation initiation factor IF-2 [Aureococcus anophagefferens]|nr:translation initiation factor IF-2 [Aureococcus anophagefferens]
MKMEKMVYREIGRVVQPPSAPAETSPEKPRGKKCHQCDRPYGDDANFCAGCGANLKEPSKKKKDGSPSRKGHRRGSSKGKPADEFPNKAYNGELPEPPPAHLARAGKYEGQLDDGVRHGHGERQRVYEGEWRRSKRHGEGKETWEDGTVYEGAFADDAFHGLGTYRTPFAKYRGNFEAGYKSGQGSVVYYKSKDTYDGEWRRNRFHGVGTYYWGNNTNGEKHEGHWKSNEKHGAGTTRTRNGKCRDGVWKHGRFVVWSGSEYFGSSSSAMHAVGNELGGDRLKGADEKKSLV